MNTISKFRFGNLAQFDDQLQRINTQTGLENAAFLDPLPITSQILKELECIELTESSENPVYLFKTFQEDGIKVIFGSGQEFIIKEQLSEIEYPFIKWVHELQNLVEDKINKHVFQFMGNERVLRREIIIK